ncbi:MAG: AbrB/MazE/SpoVT family DNA-binding domain-containing protein [Nitrospirae bacterium]|jgi:antitoxin PrlF|nr:AbrB/MazE/SpoVT family DNA-binding domain-containing protein [Nitrospirota bacterium]
MLTAKVTSKGQITIPKNVRDKLGIKAGEGINFEEKDGVFYIKKSVVKSPFDKWKGKLKTLKGKRSDEVIKELRRE